MRPIRIGVTGKLGSGKSVLLRMMEQHGYVAIRTDELARELMQRDPALREVLIGILGADAYIGEQLDRAHVASLIFNDHSLLAQVEAAVHPAVTAEVEQQFQESGADMVAVESALILKSNFREHFDYIVAVEAPKEDSIERVVRDGRLTRAEAEARLAEQDYDDRALAEADFTLENTGGKADFEEQCTRLIDLLDTLRERALPDAPLHAE